MSYDHADPPAPEDDPEGYRDYLRRKVVASARAFCIAEGFHELFDDNSHSCARTLQGLRNQIAYLDQWKKEFNLKDID
jgi:hypothetical protein